jgi:hypothetical protein
MELKIPESLELEHEELHEQLYKGIQEGGKVAEAAKAVADLLHPHYKCYSIRAKCCYQARRRVI